MKRFTGLTIVLVTLALTGCSSSSDVSGHPSNDDGGYQQALGCTSVQSKPSGEIYAQDRVTCTTAAGDVTVYTFAGPEARDNWRGVAEQLGSKVLREGDTWLAVE